MASESSLAAMATKYTDDELENAIESAARMVEVLLKERRKRRVQNSEDQA